jgi:hypothetical protein
MSRLFLFRAGETTLRSTHAYAGNKHLLRSVTFTFRNVGLFSCVYQLCVFLHRACRNQYWKLFVFTGHWILNFSLLWGWGVEKMRQAVLFKTAISTHVYAVA